MDASIRHRKNEVQQNVEEALFKKLRDCLEYSGESLSEALATADYEDTGSILKEDLSRVFKRLGLSTIDHNLTRILEIGGVSEKQERVDYRNFASKFMRALTDRLESIDHRKKMFIQKVHSML
jgi:Ca2+-binding EF-hand superfamily protein